MAKRTTPDERLTLLRQAGQQLTGPALAETVRRALSERSHFVVALAAELARQHELRELTDDLVAAYGRFLTDPIETDKGCRAKTAIVETLVQLDYDDPEFYREGMKYRQLEPAWGKPEDTASNLRGHGAFGLIRSRLASPSDTILALVDLLNDDDRIARAHAVRAIGASGSASAVPLLRLKASLGDLDPEVIGACFSAMLELDPARSVEFVGGFLRAEVDIAIEAAASLGSSRDARAATLLLSACNACSGELVEPFYISLGLSRQAEATEFLIGRIATNHPAAVIAVKALAPGRFYGDLTDRVRAAVDSGRDRNVAAVFREQFR